MKEIPEYENYLISECGTVVNNRTGRVLKPDITNRGYKRITVCKNNRVKRFAVHRLVALLFIPNPDNLPTVNHKDGNKLNNCKSNLEWMTQRENQDHAIKNNLCPKGSDNKNSKWKEEQIHKVCSLIQKRLTRSTILKMTGITKASFDDIRSRKSWKHISRDYNW